MIVGTTIQHDGTGTTPFFSPSFPRGGQAAVFTMDVTHKAGGAVAMSVDVEHKNMDETTWQTAGSFSSVTTTGVKTLDATSLKEEIRLAFSFSAGSAGDFFHVLVSAPAWRAYD